MILFAVVTKLQKLVGLRNYRFDGINGEKKQIKSDAISHR